jgi:hypothetical protein
MQNRSFALPRTLPWESRRGLISSAVKKVAASWCSEEQAVLRNAVILGPAIWWGRSALAPDSYRLLLPELQRTSLRHSSVGVVR